MSWFTSCHQLNMTYEFSWFNDSNSATVKGMRNLSTKINYTGLIILGAPNELFCKKLFYSGYFAGKIDPVLCVAGKMK